MKATDLLSSLGSKIAQRTPIAVTVVTQAEMDRVAANARAMAPVPRDVAGWEENPRFPWDAAAPLDAPGIDCSLLDRGRAP